MHNANWNVRQAFIELVSYYDFWLFLLGREHDPKKLRNTSRVNWYMQNDNSSKTVPVWIIRGNLMLPGEAKSGKSIISWWSAVSVAANIKICTPGMEMKTTIYSVDKWLYSQQQNITCNVWWKHQHMHMVTFWYVCKFTPNNYNEKKNWERVRFRFNILYP